MKLEPDRGDNAERVRAARAEENAGQKTTISLPFSPADVREGRVTGPSDKTLLRPHTRADGIPTRIDARYDTLAERTIRTAIEKVEVAGASTALTDACVLLKKALERVADHVEGIK